MQLGVGMAMPGLDKGLKGMCDTELRKLHIPYRLSRKKKSRGNIFCFQIFISSSFFNYEQPNLLFFFAPNTLFYKFSQFGRIF